jgi:hypothetical protein
MAAGAFPSALLSLGGSLVIIYTVVQKRGQMGSYECILLGLSVCDIILTVSWTLAPFLTPKDASQRITALGNDATCNMGGFLWQFSYSTYWYNGLLSFYYLTTIVYGWPEDRFKKLAPYLHGLCIGFPLVTAFLGSANEWYGPNEIGPGCWVNDYPRDCGGDPGDTGEECMSDVIAWGIGGIPVALLFLGVFGSNLVIYRHVRATLFRSLRHSLVVDSQTKRVHQVAVQCFLYVMAFWLSGCSILVVRNIESSGYDAANENRIYPLLLLQAVLPPSTGFWNMIVYLRPRYLRCHEEFPSESRLWAFRRAVFGALVGPESTMTFPNPNPNRRQLTANDNNGTESPSADDSRQSDEATTAESQRQQRNRESVDSRHPYQQNRQSPAIALLPVSPAPLAGDSPPG